MAGATRSAVMENVLPRSRGFVHKKDGKILLDLLQPGPPMPMSVRGFRIINII